MYTMPRGGRALRIAAVILTAGFLGCVDPISPFVPVVTNTLDTFDFQVATTNASRTVRYTWTTTGTSADVDLESSITGGSATVVITDADPAEVFNHALDGSGPTVTTAAIAGDWLIVITLTNVSGTVHFSLHKP